MFASTQVKHRILSPGTLDSEIGYYGDLKRALNIQHHAAEIRKDEVRCPMSLQQSKMQMSGNSKSDRAARSTELLVLLN